MFAQDDGGMIRDKLVTLRGATKADRRAVFEWLAHSDITPSVLGPPRYPDMPAPSWKSFQRDYRMAFFDGSHASR